MMKVLSKLITVIILFLLTACFWAGRWEDEQGNWKRAFNAEVPEGVAIIHSLYWRTPHFTYENGWAFQIKASDEYKKLMFDSYKLRQPNPSEKVPLIPSLNKEHINWFLPKSSDAYEMWILENEPNSNFRLFIDKESGDIFFTDWAG